MQINVMDRDTQERLLNDWENLTGWDATQDTYFSWDNEEWWEEFAEAVKAEADKFFEKKNK